MKPWLVSTLAVAMISGGAWAQSPPTPPSPPPSGMKAPPGGPDVSGPGANARDDDAGAPPPPRPGNRRPPPPPKSAHFHVEDGDNVIDVNCGDDETSKACQDFTMQLLDKLQNASKTSN